MSSHIEPFRLSVPEAHLDDLRERIARTRWPDPETVDDTSQGPPLAKLQSLVEVWREGYDWRRCETLLNEFGQFRTTIDGLGIHFLHVRSPEPDALALIMTHGWPGSVLDFRKVIGPLTDPAAHGRDPRQAFHVVIPSLPGFGFSDKPTRPGWLYPQIADAWSTLMSRLGYERWGAHGGDLGYAVTDMIGRNAPPGCVGLHLSFAMIAPDPDEIADATPEEQAMLADAKHFWDHSAAYAVLQSTRPQTLGYSLADSPVGLAAWMYAIYQDGCGTPGDAERSFTRDELLDEITLYWLSNTAASSARLYWEMARAGWSSPSTPSDPTTMPVGFSMFPKDPVRASRRWIERRYSNLLQYNALEAGGHFAALEQPERLVDELAATFSALR